MSIVDETFFVGDIYIPNSGNVRVKANILAFINKYEPECLNTLLGESLYTAYKADGSGQRMLDLLNGKSYTDQYGAAKKWIGLKHDGKLSLIANYIYFYFLRFNASQTTGVSEEVIKTDNGIPVSSGNKEVDAYNYYIKEANQLVYFLWNNLTVYPEVTKNHLLYISNLLRPINSFF